MLPNVNVRNLSDDKNLVIMSKTGSKNYNILKLIFSFINKLLQFTALLSYNKFWKINFADSIVLYRKTT